MTRQSSDSAIPAMFLTGNAAAVPAAQSAAARQPGFSLALAPAGALLALLAAALPLSAAQVVLNGPAGSGTFGTTVTLLPDGKFVVRDPGFDAPGPITDVGAVYVYRPDGVLISSLRGSTASDMVGSGTLVVLSNGNIVVRSPNWDNGAITNAGAITFLDVDVAFTGVVSDLNSLVGSHANDALGSGGVKALSNGNYVVRSPNWDNGTTLNAGAATFASGTSGIVGVVSAANSLVGTTTGDAVPSNVVELSDGNYVVVSTVWNNGSAAAAGAVTFGSGISGVVGAVSPSNSLVGSSNNDLIGGTGIVALAGGRYLVRSANWDNGAISNAGAVTFCAAMGATTGPVTALNSLVGSTPSDSIGVDELLLLSNGNYVVASSNWDNGGVANVGAVTFGSGASGVVGAVSPSNSLVGSSTGDRVGNGNGNLQEVGAGYIVRSRFWNNGAALEAGAVTFGAATGGLTGPVSASNSLVGTSSGDQVGSNVTVLSNGNYVVLSSQWDNGAITDAGAATFASGTSGRTGVVSAGNSLVGSTAFEFQSTYVVPLTDGAYLVATVGWNNAGASNAGAVTYVPSSGAVTGPVSASNSLVGTNTGDAIGELAVALTNGKYLAGSMRWQNAGAANAGAVAFGSPPAGITGTISPSNALVGTNAQDFVGQSILPLSDGSYLVGSENWNNGATANVGAVTRGSSSSGITGAVSSANSLTGSTAGDALGRDIRSLGNAGSLLGSSSWDNGAVADAGAITYLAPGAGTIGVVSPTNSLVGGTANDFLGQYDAALVLTTFANGNAVVSNPLWSNGASSGAGAVSLILAGAPAVGLVNTSNSVLGTVAGSGTTHVASYDQQRNQLIVGQRASNRVVLHRPGAATSTTIIGDSLDPSPLGQPVTFTATVLSAPSAPSAGQVSFRAASGESCVDTTPTPTGPTTADFSCQIVFVSAGSTNVIAEYTGSNSFAYSGSGPESHTAFQDNLFANSFE